MPGRPSRPETSRRPRRTRPVAAAAGALATGAALTLVGAAPSPDVLRFLEPMALRHGEPDGTVAVLVVVAERPELVAPVADVVRSLLDVRDPTLVTVETSQTLADLRAVVGGRLGTFGRTLVLGVLGVTAVLVAAILPGLVMLRRRDPLTELRVP